MKEVIAKKYVKALMLAVNPDEFDVVAKSMSVMVAAFNVEKMKDILNSPLVNAEKKVNLLISVLENPDKRIINFVKLLGQNRKLYLLPEIFSKFMDEITLRHSIYSGKLTSNLDFSDQQVKAIEDKFSAKFNSKVSLQKSKSSFNGSKIELESLGLEVSFSVDRLRAQLSEHVLKAI